MIKRSINAITGTLDQSIMHMDSDQNMLTGTSQDSHTAIKAYLSKSNPVFNGD